jgi:hypothetical protein
LNRERLAAAEEEFVKILRRMAKIGLLVMLGVQLSGCIIVPLHGWGYRHGDYDHGGYEHEHGGYRH